MKVLNKELKNLIGGKMGVYCWMHQSGKRYIGSSAYDLYNRWKQFEEKLRGVRQSTHGMKLLQFLLKTTYEEWEFEVLEIYEKGTVDKHFLEKRERYYILKYDTIKNGLNQYLPLNTSESAKLAQKRYNSKHMDSIKTYQKKNGAMKRELSASRNNEGSQS